MNKKKQQIHRSRLWRGSLVSQRSGPLATYPRSSYPQKGFTFIELLLYVVIVSIIIMALIPFAWTVIGGSIKSSSEQEVFSQSRFVSERIKFEIRDATGINSVAATSISLVKSTASLNPTVIDLSGGRIRITQGSPGTTYNLNSNTTTVSNLTFTNYTSVDNKTKNIQFVFTMVDAFGSTRQEYTVPAITIESSGEVRSN